MRDIANGQNLSGIPVLETRPLLISIFEYRLIYFISNEENKRKKEKTDAEKAVCTGGSLGIQKVWSHAVVGETV